MMRLKDAIAGTCRLSMILGIVALTINGVLGCASNKPPTLTPANYKQLLERQKAGIALDEQTVQQPPELSAEEYERLGDSYTRQSNIPMAFVQYDHSLRMDPSRVRVRYKVGHLFLLKGYWQDARQEFKEILNQDAKYAAARVGMGESFFYSGDLKEAEDNFLQALALDPLLWRAHNFLGILHDQQGRYPEAVQEFQAALVEKPQEPALHNNLGMAYYLNGQYEQALLEFKQALQGPKEPKVYTNLALAHTKLGHFQ